MLDLTDNKGRKDIKSMTLEEVTEEMAALGEKSFRAKQIYDWIHVKLAGSFDQMSSLSKELRQKLKDNYSLTCLSITDERDQEVPLLPGGRQYHRKCVDAVSSWEFRVYFLPGGVQDGLPFLRIHPGWAGAEPEAFGNAGPDLPDTGPYR